MSTEDAAILRKSPVGLKLNIGEVEADMTYSVFTPSDPNDVLNGDDKEVIISEVTFNSASTKNSAS